MKYTAKKKREILRKSRNKKKQMKGGKPPRKIELKGNWNFETISNCVKELIEFSYTFYNNLLSENKPITLVCGGQSPSYYCLAMMNFKIYDPERVNIVILPHSKGGQQSMNQVAEDKLYCQRLMEKGIQIRKEVVILDGVHSGVGILALESALITCFPYLNIRKIAINAMKGISEIAVNREYVLPCEPAFSDTFPRLVQSYHPRNFHNSSKFKTEFMIKENPIAEMIIDLAKEYPEVKVEDSEWYKINNIVTENIQRYKNKKMENEKQRIENEKQRIEKGKEEKEKLEQISKEQRKLYVNKKIKDNEYIPIIHQMSYGKIYECPICHSKSGIAAPKSPSDFSLFIHNFDCPNKNKIPVEV
jgi:hypothetical protein